ncbi:MAG TPA: methyltransferase domain-containing protein [Stellaceae bacterium]|nr:methyltransferase domain-containing protein [Stellaceae bacterium]
MAFTTAIEAWDKRWATAEGRADWLDPEPEVIALLPELKARGARTALDLGCGVGRHALYLAEHGLAVEAIDGSAAGLAVVRETARARGLSLGVRQGTADALPFDCCSFDFALSWNVIHHGTLGDVGRRLAEIWGVLKPKALYQGTMLPTRNSNYRRGRTVAPDTFVRDGAEEPGYPHFYCDAATLVALSAGFELLSLKQQLQRKPGSWHWHIIAERRP